jgi:crossover junction endodeoxyribonuclease RusA
MFAGYCVNSQDHQGGIVGKTILSLPFPPSVNRLWRVGKGKRVYKDPSYTRWISQCEAEIFSLRLTPILGSYRLQIDATRPDKRKRDIDNIIKAVSDVLQHTGIIENDHLCLEVMARWVKDGPPILISVEKIEHE